MAVCAESGVISVCGSFVGDGRRLSGESFMRAGELQPHTVRRNRKPGCDKRRDERGDGCRGVKARLRSRMKGLIKVKEEKWNKIRKRGPLR